MWSVMRSVVMVCHTNSVSACSSSVTLVPKESQRSDTTIGVSEIPLNRDDVTVV